MAKTRNQKLKSVIYRLEAKAAEGATHVSIASVVDQLRELHAEAQRGDVNDRVAMTPEQRLGTGPVTRAVPPGPNSGGSPHWFGGALMRQGFAIQTNEAFEQAYVLSLASAALLKDDPDRGAVGDLLVEWVEGRLSFEEVVEELKEEPAEAVAA